VADHVDDVERCSAAVVAAMGDGAWLAVYLLVATGSQAIGSYVWGAIATRAACTWRCWFGG